MGFSNGTAWPWIQTEYHAICLRVNCTDAHVCVNALRYRDVKARQSFAQILRRVTEEAHARVRVVSVTRKGLHFADDKWLLS